MKRLYLIPVLLLVTVGVAAAQTTLFRSEGRLQPGDTARFELTLEPGTNVAVRAASVDFQPVIEVTSGGRTTGSVGSHGGAVASTQVLGSGRFTVALSGEAPDAAGSFAIRIDRLGEISAIDFGESVEGRLEDFDMVYDVRGGYIDWYRLPLSGEEGSIAVSVRSMEFDTFLVLRLPDGTELTNDDAAGSDSLLTVDAVSGTVEVGVTSYGGEATGAYTVATARVPPPRSISVGQTVDGSFAPSELPMERYSFAGETGDAVQIEVSSSDFDTVLEVTGPDGSSERNDDDLAGMGTDSRLLYLFPESGEAEITVSAFGRGSGSYTLSVRRDRRIEEQEELPPGALLEPGALLTQLLGPGDPRNSQGSYYQEFTVEPEAGEIVELTARSSDFDTYLEVIGPGGESYQDDDSAGGTDSRVTFAAAEGSYTVRVSSFFGSSVGVFTLGYRRNEVTDEDTEIELLLRFRGEIEDEGEEPSNVHLFQARRGDRLRVELISEAFVPRFELRTPSGHILATAGGVEDTATLTIRMPNDGEYTIIAAGEEEGATGSYELSIYEE